MITLSASKTNRNPEINKTISFLKIIDTVASNAPKYKEPQSPINILAG